MIQVEDQDLGDKKWDELYRIVCDADARHDSNTRALHNAEDDFAASEAALNQAKAALKEREIELGWSEK